MSLIIIASHNPVKLKAAQNGFEQMFPDQLWQMKPVSVPSGVGDQPGSDEETFVGAKNRAHSAQEAYPEADYWVGIEGGVADSDRGLAAFAWVYVLHQGHAGYARTGTFTLPPEVARLVREGMELGDADDIVFKRENSKQQDGAVGILTDGVMDRAGFYTPAVILALIPFKQPALYNH